MPGKEQVGRTMGQGRFQSDGTGGDPTGAWLARASQGDRVALGALLEQHLPGLRRYVRLRGGPQLWKRESVSDLVQSVCIEVLVHQNDFEYRGEAQFRHWLYTTAMNKIREHLRHYGAQRRTPVREVEDGDSRLGGIADEQPSPSQNAILRETEERLARAMDALPDDYRQAILLARVIGLPHEEVAAQMGRTVDSVRNLLHRALARLAALADRDGGGGPGA